PRTAPARRRSATARHSKIASSSGRGGCSGISSAHPRTRPSTRVVGPLAPKRTRRRTRSPVLRSRSPRYQGLPGPSFPDPLPPLHTILRRRPIGVDRHLFPDPVEVPAGELGQVSSLLLAPLA